MDIATPARRPFGMSAFTLKLLAALTMTVDHVGAYLLSEVTVLRYIGRLAFPLFAYFIAEGCRYTRHKPKRFFLVFGLALLCEAGYFVMSRQITGTALLTFSCSIPIIYALQAFKRALTTRRADWIVLALALFVLSVGTGYAVSCFLPIDYGFPGVLLPVFASLFDYKEGETPAFLRHLDRRLPRLCLFGVGILGVWYFRGASALQFFGLAALLPLAFYNGQPGCRKFKYWFYIFYPAHLAIIWVIGQVMVRMG